MTDLVVISLEAWDEVWRGSRPGDRHELFILYQKR